MYRMIVIALIVMTLGCGADLPEDFRELPLEQQIAVYEKFFEDGGLSSYEARTWISSEPATAALVPFRWLRTSSTGSGGRAQTPELVLVSSCEPTERRGRPLALESH